MVDAIDDLICDLEKVYEALFCLQDDDGGEEYESIPWRLSSARLSIHDAICILEEIRDAS